MTENASKLVAHIRRTLGDLSLPLPDAEYAYAALPLCVIDAVFSLGVRYESTWRTVCEWCMRYHWEKERARATEERTISDFLRILQPYENHWEDMADNVFRNRQRTSTTSGILKAEAVFRFSTTLQRFGIETFEDTLKSGLREDLRWTIKGIPGQTSGLSFNYFLILAGNTDAVKADRMVTRFVAHAFGVRNVPIRDRRRGRTRSQRSSSARISQADAEPTRPCNLEISTEPGGGRTWNVVCAEDCVAESSAAEPERKNDAMKTKIVSHAPQTPPALTKAGRARLKALAARPDGEIDTSDIPEMTDEQWKNARRGHLYCPRNA
jgi:hypothetical protein